jgi:hypothetical protein
MKKDGYDSKNFPTPLTPKIMSVASIAKQISAMS